jgi:uroporphyrinogen-III decarboxylase
MTSRERVLATFCHEEPDRVPAWLGASPEWKRNACLGLGLPDDEALLRYLGDDFRRVESRYAGPPERSPGEMLSPGATWRSPFGIQRHGYGYGMPLENPLKDATIEQVHAYPWPDPAWIDVSHIRAAAAQWGGEFAVLGGEWSPFWHDTTDLLDFEVMVYQMYDNPDLVDAVLDHVASYYLDVSRRIFESDAAIDIFFIGNDFGAQNGPMIGPDAFRRFIVPQLRRFVELGHEFGKLVLLHSDGSLRPIMEDLIAIGIDGIQSVQPYCAGMELHGLKRDFGSRLTFFGCIDTQRLIESTPEEARQLTIDTLRTMMPGGGFIASPSHDYLLPETPTENVIIMYETIREFGCYGPTTSFAPARKAGSS